MEQAVEELRARAERLSASLVVRKNKSGPTWFGVWRDLRGKRQMKRIGPAWLHERPPLPNPFVAGSEGRAAGDEPRQPRWRSKWEPRAGRKRPGYLDDKDAAVALRGLVIEHEEAFVEAERRREEARHERERQTLEDAWAAWFSEAKYERNLRHSTLVDYAYAWRGAILPAPQFRVAPDDHDRTVLEASDEELPDIADARRRFQLMVDRAQAEGWPFKELHDISARDVRAWRDSLVQLGGVSRRTANKYLQLLRNVMGHASESEDFTLHENVAMRIKKLTERRPGFVDFFEPDEVQKIIDAMALGEHRQPRMKADGAYARVDAAHQRSDEDRQDAALVATLYFAGLRLGEALALRWRDVDFAGGVIRVERAYTLGAEDVPKGGEPRAVPLADDLVPVLDALTKRGFATDRDSLVFVGADRKGHLDGSAFRRRWKKALAVVELRELRLHSLRHGFASVVQDAASDRDVRAWVGHKDPRTLARYSHAKRTERDREMVSGAFSARRNVKLVGSDDAKDQTAHAS